MYRLSLLILVALTAVVVFALPCYAQYADVRATFLASNPNNGWEYGFLDVNGDFVAYNTTFDDGQGIAGWCLDYTPGPLGDITINYTDHPIDRYGVHWEPGQICVHPTAEGLPVVIRWHATESGSVKVETVLTTQTPDTSADMSVEANGNTLVEGQLGDQSQGLPDNGVSSSSLSLTDTSDSPSDEINRTAITSVSDGSVIDLIISSDIGPAPGYVGAVVNISELGGIRGASLNRAKLGRRAPAKQVRFFEYKLWSENVPSDTFAMLWRG